ncbi:hypothetical protein MG293_002990 [Ovis ammon polii]|uniref:Uncharacterized protein n=1 Tax=Ovis ammon polii TaxID=230172 RepID=A0AAD4UM04_OVIAM|nr:hypothetical protein MG293_002990 [Ovis ammon polii]
MASCFPLQKEAHELWLGFNSVTDLPRRAKQNPALLCASSDGIVKNSGHESVVGAAGACQGHPHALLILETGVPPASYPTPNPLVSDGVTSYMNSISMKQRKDGNRAMEHSFLCTRSRDQSMPFRQSPSDIFSSTEDLEQGTQLM